MAFWQIAMGQQTNPFRASYTAPPGASSLQLHIEIRDRLTFSCPYLPVSLALHLS